MFQNLQKFKDLLQNSKKILLINHIKMDVDAFGSLAALFLVLQKMSKSVKAVNDSETPKDFDFLLDKKIIEPELDISEFNTDLIISLDAASQSQLWEVYKKFENIFLEKNFVVIDHHQTNSWFWSLNFIYPNYSSACELLYDMLIKLDFEKYIDKEIATLLIAGIHTDTNIFYNQNTTPNTLKVASELVKLWADFRSPIYNFYQKISLNRLKLFAKAIKSLEVFWNLIIWNLKNDDFRNTNTSLEDTSGIINKLSNIEENEAICMIYEIDDWVKVSFRSKNIDIWSFCASFPNWWWHKNAAWFYLKTNLIESKKIILEKFKKFFN